jgi:dynein heavy chain
MSVPRRSLFEKDKLLFSFLLTVKILDGSKEIDATEWRFLISGKTTSAVDEENPAPEGNAGGWIDGRMWSEVCAISGAWEGFASDFKNHLTEWRSYFDCVEPHLQRLPDTWDSSLNSFQKLCVLRCLRVDKVTDGVMNYVIEKMGQRRVVPRLYVAFTPSTRLVSINDEDGWSFFRVRGVSDHTVTSHSRARQRAI